MVAQSIRWFELHGGLQDQPMFPADEGQPCIVVRLTVWQLCAS